MTSLPAEPAESALHKVSESPLRSSLVLLDLIGDVVIGPSRLLVGFVTGELEHGDLGNTKIVRLIMACAEDSQVPASLIGVNGGRDGGSFSDLALNTLAAAEKTRFPWVVARLDNFRQILSTCSDKVYTDL